MKKTRLLLLPVFVMILTLILPVTSADAAGREKRIRLYYDDRYEFDSSIKKIEQVKITSSKTGKDVPDKKVLKKDGDNKVVATGCGVARVTLESGKTVRVAVKPAPISLLLFIGQSNIEGWCSVFSELPTYKQQQILSPDGTVYSTYAPGFVGSSLFIGYYDEEISLTDDNTNSFIPGRLTYNDSVHEYRHLNNLTEDSETGGKNGIDGSFVYNWHKITGEKIWVVNAANSGSRITKWQPGVDDNYYDRAVTLYDEACDTLNNEILAGHYRLVHSGYMWMQGETDYNMSEAVYTGYFRRMHTTLKKHMTEEVPETVSGMDFTGLLMVRNLDTITKKAEGKYIDNINQNGPRAAYVDIVSSEENDFENIIMASDVQDQWMTDEGVAEYFLDEYGSLKEYIKENPMITPPERLPSKVSDVHEDIHFKQLGFNEIGRVAAINICDYLGY